MKTVTFYSYKGGVGRSLSLANMAKRLSEFNKKVCIIDFDLEAPGLHHKFQKELKNSFQFERGLIDYISEFSNTGEVPKDLNKYVYKIDFGTSLMQSIDFIPAGNIYDNLYWEKLKALDLRELMQKENKEGILLFLDLKQRIEEELKPDYLLIDSRTGITEIFGISTSLLADRVVIVSANNEENYQGSRMIINSISKKKKHFSGIAPELIFVISRLPNPKDNSEQIAEDFLVETCIKKINQENLNKENIVIIHSDRELELNESLKIGYYYSSNDPTANDYSKLSRILFDKDLTQKDKTKFQKDIVANKFFKRAVEETSREEKIKLYTEGLNLKPESHQALNNRGIAYAFLKMYDLALQDFNKAIELMPNDEKYYINRALNYSSVNQNEQALLDFNKVLELNPKNHMALFNIGFIYSGFGDYNLAINYYNKVIEIKPDFEKVWYSLGDIHFKLTDIEKSKLYFKRALDVNPNSIKSLNYLGTIHFKNREFDSAINYFNLSVNVNPNYEAYFGLGNSFFQKDSAEEAIKYYKQSLAINKDYYSALVMLGLVYSFKNDKSNSKLNLEKAIKLNPNKYQAFDCLGLLYLKSKKIIEAEKYFKIAFRIKSNGKTNKNMGHIYLIKKDFSKAVEFYKTSITLFDSRDKFIEHISVDFDILKKYKVDQKMLDDIISQL